MKDIVNGIVGLLIAYKHEIKVLVVGGVVYWIVISFIGAIPKPPDNAAGWRKWLFALANTFAGNLSRAAAAFGHTVLSLIQAIRGQKGE